jgi:Ser/Thr protein kinase RdoA (MazF antagonist)
MNKEIKINYKSSRKKLHQPKRMSNGDRVQRYLNICDRYIEDIKKSLPDIIVHFFEDYENNNILLLLDQEALNLNIDLD